MTPRTFYYLVVAAGFVLVVLARDLGTLLLGAVTVFAGTVGLILTTGDRS